MPRDTRIPLDVLAKEHMSKRGGCIATMATPLIILGYPDNVGGRFAHVVKRRIIALPRACQILFATRVSLRAAAHFRGQSLWHGNSVDHLNVDNRFLPTLGAKRS